MYLSSLILTIFLMIMYHWKNMLEKVYHEEDNTNNQCLFLRYMNKGTYEDQHKEKDTFSVISSSLTNRCMKK